MNIKIVGVSLLLSLLFISIQCESVSLSNGIATHSFELDEQGNEFISHGNVQLNNNENSDITVKLGVENRLVGCDTNNKKPRTHSIGSNKIIFHPSPSKKWITLENDTHIVFANTKASLNYTVSIPRSELDSFINNTNGYLMYITIKGNSGGNIGINYRQKVFIMFEGEQTTPFLSPYFLILLSLVIAIISFFVYDYLKKRKKNLRSVPEK